METRLCSPLAKLVCIDKQHLSTQQVKHCTRQLTQPWTSLQHWHHICCMSKNKVFLQMNNWYKHQTSWNVPWDSTKTGSKLHLIKTEPSMLTWKTSESRFSQTPGKQWMKKLIKLRAEWCTGATCLCYRTSAQEEKAQKRENKLSGPRATTAGLLDSITHTHTHTHTRHTQTHTHTHTHSHSVKEQLP